MYTLDPRHPWVNHKSAFVGDIDFTCDSLEHLPFLKKIPRGNMYYRNEKHTWDSLNESFMKTFSDN